jgi:hypothetical protein
VDAANHIPVDISKVLNVELLNASGQSMKQVRIRLSKGLGNGQIFVSPDLPSGQYRVQAYTNWMKNFDPELVFQQSLKIINPSSVKESKDLYSRRQASLQFFPEGGQLVAGLSSKVAVKAVDGFGNGLSVAGLVYDNEDNEIVEFATSDFGYAHFSPTPDPGKSYAARIDLDSTIQKYPLPDVMERGMVLTVNTLESGDLNIAIDHTEHVQSNPYLVVHTRGIINKILPVDLGNSKNINIYASELSPGISHITLLDNDYTAMCERLVFKYPEDSDKVDLTMDNSQYGSREEVAFSLDLSQTLTKDELAHLSVSVSRWTNSEQENGNIVDHLLLSSDLKGPIPNPPGLLDPKNKSNARLLDLIMLTNGWRRFDWDGLKQDQNIPIAYPAEINAPILSGKIIQDEQEKLPKALQVNFLGKAAVMNSTALNEDGSFHIEVPFRVSTEKVLFFINDDTLFSDQLSVFSPFDLQAPPAINFNSFDPVTREYLETLNNNIQISQVYRDHNHINGLTVEIQESNSTFYGMPDHLYLLDDFTRFETVEDLFIEYIRTAVIRDNRRTSGFFVIDEEGMMPAKALTLIDGVPIFDFDYMMNFDPLLVESIGVVTDQYRMGNIEYSGIIEFTTYQGDFNGEDFPGYIVEKVYHGLQQPRIFSSPDYVQQHDLLARIPDYRNTLYWNPHVEIKGHEQTELQFFTADDSGLYQVQINGITNEGQPVYLQTSFVVK